MNRLAQLCFTLAAVAAFTTSCIASTEAGFPENARPITPPAQFRVWWQVTEACSGTTSDFDAVQWYVVPDGSLAVDGTKYEGYTWLGRSPRIVVEQSSLDGDGLLIRHEMLHVLSGVGKHLRRYYVEKCGGIVACEALCEREAGGYPPPGVTDSVVEPERLEIYAYLRPLPVSRSADSSWVAIVVEARNPLPFPVRVQLRDGSVPGGLSGVQLWYDATGGFYSGQTFNGDTLVAFAAGQTRRIVFDTRAYVPGLINVQSGRQTLTGGFSSMKGTPVVFDVVP